MNHYTVIENETEHQATITQTESGFSVEMEGKTHHFELLLESECLYSFLIDGSQVLEADVDFSQDNCELSVQNIPYHLEVFDPRRRRISQSGSSAGGGLLSAPMPGKIVEVKVKTGDQVQKGDQVIIIEAMKMQNELEAPSSGTVQEVAISANEAVEGDQKLIVIEKD